MNRVDAMNLVLDELSEARKLFPPFNSYHEGYAILLEEVDELWEEIKANVDQSPSSVIRGEAVQVAAMALRFLVDLCREE